MRYCARCLYPENARPTIIFDEEGICSGCRYHESRDTVEVDWDQRVKIFETLLDEARAEAKKRGNSHECIIPVSGGKDSHFQVWLLKKKYGLNPLLVSFNHVFNTSAGNRNLENLVEKSGCDHIRYTAGVDSVRRISRLMLEKVGDLTWHYHAGIRTLPFQVAVNYDIPFVIWGEHGFAELTGLVTLEDFVEFTKWTRREHDMRGYEPEQLIGQGGVTERDIRPYVYPSDDDIARCGVRGIYLSNFYRWDAKEHCELMMKEWNFGTITYKRDRTFNLYAKIEDHANDVHDFLKYLKFGYGRATDDASMEIRHGRMTREEGMQMVKEYDANVPTSLSYYLDFLGVPEKKFYEMVDSMRDSAVWEVKGENWKAKYAVFNELTNESNESARVKMSGDRTFSEENRNLYYNIFNPPIPSGEPALDVKRREFDVL